MANDNSVDYIRQIGVCCGCGACVGACKRNAVSMSRNAAGYIVPVIDESNCSHCGMCMRVCPSFCGNKLTTCSENPFVGESIGGYIGYAQDAQYRANGQSGGVVSAVLSHLFKTRSIDGAVVNVFDKSINRNVPELITNIDDLPRSFGSYYAQSPVVELILKHREKRLAVVTLGCQTQALKLFLRSYPLITVDVLIIGLFCAGNYSGDYIDDLICASHVDPMTVNAFRFRYKDCDKVPWPGKVMVASRDERVVLPSHCRTLVKRLYEVPRCRFCYDQLNVFADISIGDPWGVTREDNRLGNSVIITRTPKGEDAIRSAIKAEEIVAEKCKVGEIVAGQTVNTRLKRDIYLAASIAKQLRIAVPYIPVFAFEDKCTTGIESRIRERVIFSLRQMTSDSRDDILNERELLRKRLISEDYRSRILSLPRRMIGLLVSQIRKMK